jgi:Fe-S-cluster containining protein
MADDSAERTCGECSLCCTVLRVDELSKLGGTRCRHQREGPAGCSIHSTRPGICRAYRCLWLQGGLEEGDRPDRLGAVLDVLAVGETHRLEIREAARGNFDRVARLGEIAERYRVSMPVRISDVDTPLDPDTPFRMLLPGGEEQRVVGDRITLVRDGVVVGERRLPWLERSVRRLALAWKSHRLRRARR